MKYCIRAIDPSDLKQLILLCARHAELEGGVYNAEGKSDRLKQALFAELKTLHCWVVESENKLVGYCSFTFDYSTWDACTFLHMDCLYLEPEFRNHRIGDEIIRRLKALADQNGCVNVQWQTPAFNIRAIKFYKRIGATEKEKSRFFM